jgi:hypothetical protein
MSSATDRLGVIEQNYESALDNDPHDLARATTAEQVTAIQANVSVARQTYYTSIAAQLTKSGEAVEAAYNAATAANAGVDTARSQAAEIPILISNLTFATKSATDLANAAKSAVA